MRDRMELPAGAWIVAALDLLVGVSLFPITLGERPTATDDGLGAFDRLIFLLSLTDAALLLIAAGCVFRQREKALKLAGGFQRWAAWTFLLHGVADIGLSLMIVNDSLTGTFTFMCGLILLIPAALSFWGSRSLAAIGRRAGQS